MSTAPILSICRSLSALAALAGLAGCAVSTDGEAEQQASSAPELAVWPPIWRFGPLAVESVEPPVPVENRPMHVYFTFSNTTNEPLDGYVGASLHGSGHTGPISGQTSFSQDWRIRGVPPGGRARGVVTIDAPAAGRSRLVKLYFYRTAAGPHVNETTRVFDSAMRFRVGLDSLFARSTRGPSVGPWQGDDVFVSMNARLGANVVWEDELFAGHAGDRTLLDVRRASPPLEIVPDASPDLKFAFAAAALNNPSKEQARAALNLISQLGKQISNTIYPQYGKFAELLDWVHQQINNALTAQCNGAVAADAIAWTSGELDTSTQHTDELVRLGQHPGTPSPAVCGGTSFYTSQMRMTRLRANTDTARITPQAAWTRAGQAIQFSSNVPPQFARWSVEGDPAQVGTIGTSTGVYVPGSALTTGSFVTVTVTDTNPDEAARKRPAKAFVSRAAVPREWLTKPVQP